jgi:His/Glu/Gln/Arg/opine family amino acid ABC transporter permease subunit
LNFRWDAIQEYLPFFISGAYYTIEYTVICILLATLLGLFLGLGRLSRNLLIQGFVKMYVSFFRGTPLLVQILLFHFAVLPAFFGGKSPGAFISGIVAVTLNYAAYSSEVFRAGIQSIDRGQWEAARSLGMTHGQMMRHVVLPQAFRRMLPPLGNEAIALLKDTSLLAVIAGGELTYNARAMAGSTLLVWEPYLTLAVFYYVLTFLLARVVAFLERRFGTP